MLCLHVCVGSSCHLKGSSEVVAALGRLIAENKLEKRVELTGSFCMQNCMKAVSVRVGDGEIFSVSPQTAEQFFYETVVPLACKD
jgi:NADH:ubiquinone oxidoreductase subunit E